MERDWLIFNSKITAMSENEEERQPVVEEDQEINEDEEVRSVSLQPFLHSALCF